LFLSFDRCGEKCDEHTSSKNKKKVRFNLNVKIYRPNLTEYQILDNEWEKSGNTNGEAEGSAILTMTYPSNYRYYSYKEDCDNEDDITYEESDNDADTENNNNNEFDDGDGDGREGNKEFEACDQNTRQKELLKLYSLVAEERIRNQLPLAPTEAYLKSYLCGQNRSSACLLMSETSFFLTFHVRFRSTSLQLQASIARSCS